MKNKKLKLYVWQDVLTDYSSGIMFALAENIDEARKNILVSEDECHQKTISQELEELPDVYENECGFVVWGGG